MLMGLACVTAYTSGAWAWCQFYAKHIGCGWGKDDSIKAKKGNKIIRMENAKKKERERECILASPSIHQVFPQTYGNECELRLDMPVPKFCTGTLETELETVILRFRYYLYFEP